MISAVPVLSSELVPGKQRLSVTACLCVQLIRVQAFSAYGTGILSAAAVERLGLRLIEAEFIFQYVCCIQGYVPSCVCLIRWIVETVPSFRKNASDSRSIRDPAMVASGLSDTNGS